MNSEFPKIEHSVAERREIMERDLPIPLQRAGEHYFQHYYTPILNAMYAQSGHPDVFRDILDLKLVDWAQVSKKLLEDNREEKYLEVVALCDLEVSILEQELDQMGIQKSFEFDYEGRAKEQEDVIQSRQAIRDRYADYRDWLIEEVPSIRQEAKREEFFSWVSVMMERYQELMQGARGRKDAASFNRILEAYKALEAIPDRVPTSHEMSLILDAIDREINYKRLMVSALFINFVLNRPYERGKLFKAIKEIVVFRQFRSNVESREWIKTSG